MENPQQCPHTMQMGSHEARIVALEKGMEDLEHSIEDKINKVTAMAQNNAVKIIEDKANQSGFIKGVHITATLIGYAIIIGLLLMAGKFTGAIESFLKLLSGKGL
ncbi:hypothetical protein [Nitrosomonas sp.]|uniref:hypothetical protein n=1 Tax=Nitrosomonas sp. TaxID=42353 RepID=UPI0025F2010B|nr:hypothetical protein [Nitrosomonas sp.]